MPIPVWTPDGRRLIFSSERAGGAESLLAGGGRHRRGRAADRESQPAEPRRPCRPTARRLIFTETAAKTGEDVMQLRVGRDASRDAARAVPVHRAERDRLARRPLARLRGE